MGGALSSVFNKVSSLHARNGFSFAIVVGDLFADPSSSTAAENENVEDLLKGGIKVPLPTYFALGSYALPQRINEKLDSSGELTSNLYFLGKRTAVKTSEGIKIVALGGSLDSNITAGLSNDKSLPFYTENDARSLFGANSADILITNQWPSSIHAGSKIRFDSELDEPSGHQCIADLCATLKPRYHFSTSPGTFWEREPFFHMPNENISDSKPITRFISLASYGNPRNQKWLYAFTLDPTAPLSLSIPPGATASPLLTSSRKRSRLPDQEQSYSRFSQSDHHHRPSRRSRPPPTPAECFFCLSNPNLATHLITSIATDTYLTIAKGPLSTVKTYPVLGFPAHILIIPLTHSPTLDLIPDPVTRTSTYQEMQRYRKILHGMLKKIAKSDLGAVTWEVSRESGVHIHWQFLPVSSDLVKKGLVEAAFRVEAENEKYPNLNAKEIGDGSGENNDYFRVWIWRAGDGDTDEDEGTEKSLVLPLSSNFRFDVQFGRRVLAKLLQLERRLDWKDCLQSQADEVADAEAFKKAFKEFDFSLAED